MSGCNAGRLREVVLILVGLAGLSIAAYALLGFFVWLYHYNRQLFQYLVLLLGGLSIASMAGKALKQPRIPCGG